MPLKRSNRLHWIIKKGKTTHGHEIEMLLEGVEELRKSKIYYQVYSADEIKKIDAIVADSIAIIKERMNKAINRGRFRDFRESGSYGANLTLLHKFKLFRDAFTEYEQHTAETFYEKHKIVW